MAPSIHPPCTPSASCQPMRCHPTPPPCADPEKCIAETIRKNTKPCASAVSILATRSRTKCVECNRLKSAAASNAGAGTGAKGRKGNTNTEVGIPTNAAVKQYLDRKSMETKLRREDRLMGTHKYTEYRRKMGSPRATTDCCAGHGHRGRLSRGAASAGTGGTGGKGGKGGKGRRERPEGEKKKGGCAIL